MNGLTLWQQMTAVLTLAGLLSACRRMPEAKAPPEPAASRKPALAAAIEKFTGAHTRIVWAEVAATGETDTYAYGEGLVLKGLDTGDDQGERTIQPRPGNYSRPLLSTDGTCILWTDKNTVRKGHRKIHRPVIYLTGWKGGRPIRIAEGYAVDCWLDRKTGVEWVYAVQDVKPTRNVSLDGNKLVRFPLHEEEKVETVYDATPITPDNVQFSRDGTRASGLFPWPHAGVLKMEGGQWTPAQLTVGCWTSMAPDNSGVSWSFDGAHKSVMMFANDGAQSWPVSFDSLPDARGRELYHPRWSNHPRFIALTGPYTKQTAEDGSVVNKGGATARVFLGRLTPTADRVEGWLQISHANCSATFPDVWIAGAEKADLVGFKIPPKSAGVPFVASAWPANRAGLLFLWKDRASLNAIVARDGRKLESTVDARGAARHGRLGEMLLDGGAYEAAGTGVSVAAEHLRGQADASLEALVLPPSHETGTDAQPPSPFFTAPGFCIFVEKGKLLVARPGGGVWESMAALPVKPFHLIVNRRNGSPQDFEAFVNGEPVALGGRSGPFKAEPLESLTFGGGWNGGLMQVALYDRLLTDEEINANAQAAQKLAASFPPPPLRVKVKARLVEASALPTADSIAPYTCALLTCLYDVETVLEGEVKAKQVLVKHWCMLDQRAVKGFPRQPGRTYELVLEPAAQHTHLKGERVMDDTSAFDLEPWFDVSPPRVE